MVGRDMPNRDVDPGCAGLLISTASGVLPLIVFVACISGVYS